MTTEAKGMYTNLVGMFDNNTTTLYNGNMPFYDVDMFRHDVQELLFTETDPQDIDEDDFLTFQECLILLVRDDTLLDHFGLDGLAVLHADLMNDGEAYYINKVLFK